jgi:hypothetical protein
LREEADLGEAGNDVAHLLETVDGASGRVDQGDGVAVAEALEDDGLDD